MTTYLSEIDIERIVLTFDLTEEELVQIQPQGLELPVLMQAALFVSQIFAMSVLAWYNFSEQFSRPVLFSSGIGLSWAVAIMAALKRAMTLAAESVRSHLRKWAGTRCFTLSRDRIVEIFQGRAYEIPWESVKSWSEKEKYLIFKVRNVMIFLPKRVMNQE